MATNHEVRSSNLFGRAILAVLLPFFLFFSPVSLLAADDVLQVRAPWARVAAPGVPVAAGYLQLLNTGKEADELLGASSPRARSVQIHETQLVEGVMRMREVPSVALAPGATVALEPGGLHLMIMGLAPGVTEGTQLPVTLRFKRAGEKTISMEVRSTR